MPGRLHPACCSMPLQASLKAMRLRQRIKAGTGGGTAPASKVILEGKSCCGRTCKRVLYLSFHPSHYRLKRCGKVLALTCSSSVCLDSSLHPRNIPLLVPAFGKRCMADRSLSQTSGYRSWGQAYRCITAGGTSHYPQLSEQAQQSTSGWQALDNGAFDEVSLGSPPLKPGKAISNGGVPHLDKVASSLRAYSEADKAAKLHTENAELKQRLAAIESVSASVKANSICQSTADSLRTVNCVGAVCSALSVKTPGYSCLQCNACFAPFPVCKLFAAHCCNC